MSYLEEQRVDWEFKFEDDQLIFRRKYKHQTFWDEVVRVAADIIWRSETRDELRDLLLVDEYIAFVKLLDDPHGFMDLI